MPNFILRKLNVRWLYLDAATNRYTKRSNNTERVLFLLIGIYIWVVQHKRFISVCLLKNMQPFSTLGNFKLQPLTGPACKYIYVFFFFFPVVSPLIIGSRVKRKLIVLHATTSSVFRLFGVDKWRCIDMTHEAKPANHLEAFAEQRG